jgi:hypothetical protein
MEMDNPDPRIGIHFGQNAVTKLSLPNQCVDLANSYTSIYKMILDPPTDILMQLLAPLGFSKTTKDYFPDL